MRSREYRICDPAPCIRFDGEGEDLIAWIAFEEWSCSAASKCSVRPKTERGVPSSDSGGFVSDRSRKAQANQ
jgi:hypothetical protein